MGQLPKFHTENENLSGAPERIKNHAEKIIDMALDMKDCATFIQDPRLKENAGKSAKYNQKYRGPKISHQFCFSLSLDSTIAD